MPKINFYLDQVIYWLIIFLPFSAAISPAPMNVFMGFLLAAFLCKKAINKERLFVKNSLGPPLLFLFLITLLSIFHSINIKDTLKGGILRLLQYIFIFFILAQELRDKKHIGRIIFAVTLGITIVSLDEIWQVATGKDFIRGYLPIINLGLVRATASFKDSNTLGIYLSGFSPLIFGLTIYYFKGKKKTIFILVSLLALTGVALTYSRPTLLAVYLALLFLAAVKKDKLMLSILLLLLILSPFLVP